MRVWEPTRAQHSTAATRYHFLSAGHPSAAPSLLCAQDREPEYTPKAAKQLKYGLINDRFCPLNKIQDTKCFTLFICSCLLKRFNNIFSVSPLRFTRNNQVQFPHKTRCAINTITDLLKKRPNKRTNAERELFLPRVNGMAFNLQRSW